MSYKKQNAFSSFNSVMDFSLLCLVDSAVNMGSGCLTQYVCPLFLGWVLSQWLRLLVEH